jgi:hypothetical protein
MNRSPAESAACSTPRTADRFAHLGDERTAA